MHNTNTGDTDKYCKIDVGDAGALRNKACTDSAVVGGQPKMPDNQATRFGIKIYNSANYRSWEVTELARGCKYSDCACD